MNKAERIYQELGWETCWTPQFKPKAMSAIQFLLDKGHDSVTIKKFLTYISPGNGNNEDYNALFEFIHAR